MNGRYLDSVMPTPDLFFQCTCSRPHCMEHTIDQQHHDKNQSIIWIYILSQCEF